MAPTEILVRQHLATITPLAEKAGIRVAILTGRERGKERTETLERWRSARSTFWSAPMRCSRRRWRSAISRLRSSMSSIASACTSACARPQGRAVDMLVLTATPIPRTLVLTYFGDMEISELREKPAGRQPIDTRTIALDRLNEVVHAVGRALDEGKRVYWVCPLVAESETSDLAAAEERFAELRQQFGAKVDLVHGQMKGSEKDAAMARFSTGQSQLLVATTVIEVGVDVPAATIMVIEHAERFGLSQLHQLRAASAGATSVRPAYCFTARRSAKPPRPGSPSCATPRTDPHCRGGFAAARRRRPARHAPERHAGFPRGAARIPRQALGAGARRRHADAHRDPDLASPRGEALRHLLYLTNATRRSGYCARGASNT